MLIVQKCPDYSLGVFDLNDLHQTQYTHSENLSGTK